jgi:hypothetical protein
MLTESALDGTLQRIPPRVMRRRATVALRIHVSMGEEASSIYETKC